MPTITDTLTQLGQDLRDAIASVRGVYTDILSVKNSAVSQTTTIINNFVNKPRIATYFVDPYIGSDTNDGSSLLTPFKTLDHMFDVMDLSVGCSCVLLGDDMIKVRRAIPNSLRILGAIRGDGGDGLGFIGTLRRISWLPEAVNSTPKSASGRCVPFMDFSSGTVLFNFIEFHMPSPPAVVVARSLFVSYGVPFAFFNCAISVETDDSLATLFQTQGGFQASVSFTNTTRAANTAGKLFGSILAGGDPNALFYYVTNIKSA